MKEKFLKANYEIADFNEVADIYVINSCSVTNLSTRKTRQELSKAKRRGGVVVLCGCYSQEITGDKKLENVDIVIGNEEKNNVVSIVEEYLKSNIKDYVFKVSDISKVTQYGQKSTLSKNSNIRESVKIEDGCNNFCSYCIIPYVRGRVRSRNIESILAEVESLVKTGVGEVVLVGIEIASYGKDLSNLSQNITLIDVIEKVAKVEGLKRIRLGSIEPRFLTDENIIRLSKVEKLCPHFHLSVQSLDNNVLKRMNRKYTKEYILDRVNMLKKYIKDVALTCDIIVGFPGETDEEFFSTVAAVKEISFYEMHVFKYSKRKWTKAADMTNQVDGNIALKRSETLIKIANENKIKFMKKYLNTKQKVLFESYINGYLYGYTSNYIKVKVKGDEKLWGSLQEIELCSIEKDLILGRLLQ